MAVVMATLDVLEAAPLVFRRREWEEEEKAK